MYYNKEAAHLQQMEARKNIPKTGALILCKIYIKRRLQSALNYGIIQTPEFKAL